MEITSICRVSILTTYRRSRVEINETPSRSKLGNRQELIIKNISLLVQISFWRARKTAPMKKPLDLISIKELAYVAILTFLLTFLSFVACVRTEPAEWPPGGLLILYGFPFGWVKIKTHLSYSFLHEVEIIWTGLVLDLILYFLLSFVLVYVAARLGEAIS